MKRNEQRFNRVSTGAVITGLTGAVLHYWGALDIEALKTVTDNPLVAYFFEGGNLFNSAHFFFGAMIPGAIAGYIYDKKHPGELK